MITLEPNNQRTTEYKPIHTCHWPGCGVEVPPAMWGCKVHWFLLPARLRRRIWATYKPGQEITKQPSDAYLAAAKAVRDWIAQYLRSPQDAIASRAASKGHAQTSD